MTEPIDRLCAHPDDMRSTLEQPVRWDGWKACSDGCVLAMVPLELPTHYKPMNLDAVVGRFVRWRNDWQWVSVAELQEAAGKPLWSERHTCDADCGACGGAGLLYCCDTCPEMTCPVCEGHSHCLTAGRECVICKAKKEPHIEVLGVPVRPYLLARLLATAPTSDRIEAVAERATHGGLLALRAGRWVGLVAGLSLSTSGHGKRPEPRATVGAL